MINGYSSGWEHLLDEMKKLDLRIHIHLKQQEQLAQESPFQQLRGLVLSEEEMLRLLQESSAPQPDDEVLRLQKSLVETEERIRARLRRTDFSMTFLPIYYVADVFGLSEFEMDCLLICLAYEADRKYEKLFAYLQDDVTCKSPTIDLMLKLLCRTTEDRVQARSYFTPDSTLHKYFFEPGEDRTNFASLLSRVLKLDERIAGFLLQTEHSDELLSRVTMVIEPDDDCPELLIDTEYAGQMADYVLKGSFSGEGNRRVLFFIWGQKGAGKKLQAQHMARRLNRKLLIADLRLIGMSGDRSKYKRTLARLLREAMLQQAIVCFAGFEKLLDGSEDAEQRIEDLLERLRHYNGIICMLSELNWRPTQLTSADVCMHVELGVPGFGERLRLWQALSERYSFTEETNFSIVANAFRFTTGQIADTLQAARNLAEWKRGSGAPIGLQELYDAGYSQVQHNLAKKAKRLKPKYGWDDLILPEEQLDQLRSACSQVKFRHIVFDEWGFERKLSYGKGLSMLFSGPPGTGKTMSAEVVARELNLEIYKIDLSQVVSKYIGETEKNLQEIFGEAQLSNAILFFDETDALFGKRSEVKDSHDKYANIETAFLLQKMEEYEGISILATNYQQNIDEAFMRRINYVIKFPFPDAQYREQIWRTMYPRQTPLQSDVDFRYLAEKLELAGGNIKNIVVSSAFHAAESGTAVGMKHIVRAARHELRKNGKILLMEDLF